MRPTSLALPSLLLLALLPSCGTTSYDLSLVPVPVLANDLGYEDVERAPFRETEKTVLWVHGLFGETVPDVGRIVRDKTEDAEAVVNFRVTRSAGFHDWLITHLSLTLVRMKTVTVEGELVRNPPSIAPR